MKTIQLDIEHITNLLQQQIFFMHNVNIRLIKITASLQIYKILRKYYAFYNYLFIQSKFFKSFRHLLNSHIIIRK